MSRSAAPGASLSESEEYGWISLWNRGIVALYFILYFLDGVTRYKHLTAGLMYITALIYICKYNKKLLAIFKNNLSLALAILTLVTVYSVFISPDTHYSLKKAANSIFEQLVLISVVIPIILHRESQQRVAKLFIFSLIAAIIPIAVIDIQQYITEYHNGILPFTGYEHRYRSDAFIFMSLALLNLWLAPGKLNKVIFVVLFFLIGFMILGTLQRGTWLAILAPAVVWVLVKREWRLTLFVLAITAIGGLGYYAVSQVYFPSQKLLLAHKLQQTSSNHRFGNGTQGAAFDQIMQNPLKGHGFGDDIYLRGYASNMDTHPGWFFREPIGPHNITLDIWYSAGIAGVIALWFLLGSLAQTALKGYRNTTSSVVKQAWLTIMILVLGDFVIRGLFETVSLKNAALLIGIALIMKFSAEKSAVKTA